MAQSADLSQLMVVEPVFQNKIWGGRRLKREFGYEIPAGPVGECWAISAHPHGDCLIKEGPGKGTHLSELWESERELFGNLKGDRFPLLIKIIDAEADLSVQVHPDDAYAAEHEGGSLGKRECWFILDAAPNATIVVGQKAANKEEFAELVQKGQWDELLNSVPVRPGDFFQIDPGTVHALRAGTLLLETQQSSDVTYRLYDYDRRDEEGNLRELHIDKSIDVVNFSAEPPEEGLAAEELLEKAISPAATTALTGEESTAGEVLLEKNDNYTVSLIQVTGFLSLPMEDPFWCVSVVEGEGSINGLEVHKGDHLIVPATVDEVRFEGTLRLVTSHV